MKTIIFPTLSLLLALASATEASAFTLLQPGVKGWVNGQVTFDYDFTECTQSRDQLIRVMDRAMTLWNAVPTAHVKMKRGTEIKGVNPAALVIETEPGDAIFTCSTNFKADTGRPTDNTLAIGGAAVDSEGKIGFGYAILNDDPQALSAAGSVSEDELAAVVAHEFGHALGLGHSLDSTALMFSEAASVPTLDQDDVDAITSLYARPPTADSDDHGLFGCAKSANADEFHTMPNDGDATLERIPAHRHDFGGAMELAVLVAIAYLGTRRIRTLA